MRYLWRDEVWAEVDRREVFDGGGHVGGGIGAVFWAGHWSVLGAGVGHVEWRLGKILSYQLIDLLLQALLQY